MNNDIIPPSRPPRQGSDATQSQGWSSAPADKPYQFPQVTQPSQRPVRPMQQNASPRDEAASQVTDVPLETPKKPRRKKYIQWVIVAVLVVILSIAAAIAWYEFSLRPVSGDTATRVQVVVAPGSSPSQIGKLLEEKKLIRSQQAFDIYTRIHQVRNKLLAGEYRLSPSESTQKIVEELTVGQSEEFDVTFYPGATLNIASTAADKTPSHRQVLQKLGYSDAQIDEAFGASYASEYPVLFADKPATADLEGYIYGQTYKVASGATVKQILGRTFAEYEKQIKENNLVASFKSKGLNLYQGITLASIIQREVPTVTDQKQVAQIFFTRLESGMMLGSDVTYHYAADKAGIARDYTLNSAYNTRKVTGLPPGPIASPGITSLKAVAEPAEGDYVYFLSGDDDKTYFARTNAEHEANIVNHCAYKCSLP